MWGGLSGDKTSQYVRSANARSDGGSRGENMELDKYLRRCVSMVDPLDLRRMGYVLCRSG